MPKLADPDTAMVDNLRDLLGAEKQLVQALPEMARGAGIEDLKTAFTGEGNEGAQGWSASGTKARPR